MPPAIFFISTWSFSKYNRSHQHSNFKGHWNFAQSTKIRKSISLIYYLYTYVYRYMYADTQACRGLAVTPWHYLGIVNVWLSANVRLLTGIHIFCWMLTWIERMPCLPRRLTPKRDCCICWAFTWFSLNIYSTFQIFLVN